MNYKPPFVFIISSQNKQIKGQRGDTKMEDNQKKLYRSDSDKMLCGVCGGIAEYFNVDSTLIRLLWSVLACTGTGILAYFIAAIIIPRR